MGNTHPRNVKRSINQKAKLLVLIIGGPCTGKSSVSKHLSTHFQLVPIAPDLLIRECVDQHSLRKPEARLERLHRQRLKTYNALLIHQKMTKEEKEFLGKGGDSVGTVPTHLFHPSDSEEDDFVNVSPVVQEIQRSLKHGEPIDPVIISDLIVDAMRCSFRCNGFIVDGFPRNLDQYLAFVQVVGDPHAIVYLDCPTPTMIDRSLKRAESSQRFDDNEPFLNMRIDSFRKKVSELLDHWKESGITVLNVQATDDLDKVKTNCTHEVKKIINDGQFKVRKYRDWNKLISVENVKMPQVTQILYSGGDKKREEDAVVKLA